MERATSRRQGEQGRGRGKADEQEGQAGVASPGSRGTAGAPQPVGRNFELIHGGSGLEVHACFSDEKQQHQGLRIPFLINKPCQGRGTSWVGFLLAASGQLHPITRQGMGTSQPPGRVPCPAFARNPQAPPRGGHPASEAASLCHWAELWVLLLHCSRIHCVPLLPGTVPDTVPDTVPGAEATALMPSAGSAGPPIADILERARPWVCTESPEVVSIAVLNYKE